MVASAGAGPQPIPQQQLNTENLADAIRLCLRQDTLQAAQGLAARMQSETGVQTAVNMFHESLPADILRCDILSDRAAAWSYKKGKKHSQAVQVGSGATC